MRYDEVIALLGPPQEALYELNGDLHVGSSLDGHNGTIVYEWRGDYHSFHFDFERSEGRLDHIFVRGPF
jgi:hypothetical protein